MQASGVTKIQTKNCTFTASSAPTCQFANSVASGDVGVASIETTVNSIGVTTVSDGTNTYNLVASDSVLTAVGLNAVYCWNYASLGTTPTITFTLGAAATGGIMLYDLSGAAASCNITGSDASEGRNALSSSMSVASYTPSGTGFEIGFFNIASTVATFTVGASFTKDNDATSGTDRIVSESITNTGTATTTPATLSIAAPWNEISVMFVATAETLVTQPIAVCESTTGMPTGTSFSLFVGGTVRKTIFTTALPCNTFLNVPADKNSPITIEVATDGANTRYGFNASSDSRQTAIVNTCAAGTCGNVRLDVYYELQQTYQATPKTAQTTWDSGLQTQLAIGTVTGAAASTVASIPLPSGGGAQTATGWADYNLPVVIGTSTIAGAPANSQWGRDGSCSFTQTTGGNTDNCDWWKAWSNNVKYSVSHGSPTAPSMTCNYTGSPLVNALTTSYQAFYCDNGATMTATDPTTGSTSSERWSDNAQSFVITAGGANDIFAYYDQLQNTCKATPLNPATWDAVLSVTCVGTQFGTAGVTGCTITTSNGGGFATCAAWFDYSTAYTVLSPVAASSTEQWKQSSGPTGNVFTDTTGGNTRNVNYGRQWQVIFAVSPLLSGTISPSATAFYNDGTNGSTVALTAAAYSGNEFSSWTGPAGVTFSATAPYTASANVQGAGTITANFASSANNQQIGGGGFYYVSNSTTSLGAYNGPPNPISGLAAEAIVAIVIAIAGIAYFESHQNHVKVFRSYMGLQPKRREPRKERGII